VPEQVKKTTNDEEWGGLPEMNEAHSGLQRKPPRSSIISCTRFL